VATPARNPMSLTPVLLVEDDPHGIELLTKYLGNHHFALTVARDETEALAALDQPNRPWFLITDLNLKDDPNAGLSLIAKLRQNPRWAELPILVLSGRGDAAVILKALELGASDYMTKPYRLEELAKRCDRLARQSLLFDLALPAQRPPKGVRELSLEVLQAAVQGWELVSGKNKVELAIESGEWKVHANPNGSYSARTLDRYLNLETLPHKPNLGKVLRTVEFVAQRVVLPPSLAQKLARLSQGLSEGLL